MARIRVQLRGLAPGFDPNVTPIMRDHIPFPTWVLLSFNPATARAVIEIPDSDYEQPQAGEVPTVGTVQGIPNVITQLAPTHRARFLKRIRERYQENAANYDVQEA